MTDSKQSLFVRMDAVLHELLAIREVTRDIGQAQESPVKAHVVGEVTGALAGAWESAHVARTRMVDLLGLFAKTPEVKP